METLDQYFFVRMPPRREGFIIVLILHAYGSLYIVICN